MKQSLMMGVFFLLSSAAISISPAQPAAAAQLSAAMLKPMHEFASGAATMSVASLSAACTADAAIVDEFAPYVWSGPNSPSRYAAALRAWVNSGKLANIHVRYQDPRYFDMVGSSAWASMPATFSFTENGKPSTERGIYAFVLTKTASGWKVQSVSWATISSGR